MLLAFIRGCNIDRPFFFFKVPTSIFLWVRCGALVFSGYVDARHRIVKLLARTLSPPCALRLEMQRVSQTKKPLITYLPIWYLPNLLTPSKRNRTKPTFALQEDLIDRTYTCPPNER